MRAADPTHPAIVRLDAHIHWYDYVARLAMRRLHRIRTLQIATGAVIPVTQVALAGATARIVAAALGGVVILLQGLEGIWHDAEHYPSYRETAQALQRERHAFNVPITPYDDPPGGKAAIALLVERTESIVAAENQRWKSTQTSGSGPQQADQ